MRVSFGTTGIIIAFLVFYFWGSIKDFFDQESSQSKETVNVQSEANKEQPPKAPQQKNNEKVDSFKEFK
jgi:hypothetical protein